MIRTILLVLSVLAACERPAPLGTFTRDDLPTWASDCETTIVEEDPHDPRGPRLWERGHSPAFASATRRFRCPPPGWAIYTDKRNRIVGFCVDDDWRLSKHDDQVIAEIDRARTLITSHWGVKRAGEMLKGITGDRCSVEPETVAGNMWRWSMRQLVYPPPEKKLYSNFMCCWEVKE